MGLEPLEDVQLKPVTQLQLLKMNRGDATLDHIRTSTAVQSPKIWSHQRARFYLCSVQHPSGLPRLRQCGICNMDGPLQPVGETIQIANNCVTMLPIELDVCNHTSKGSILACAGYCDSDSRPIKSPNCTRNYLVIHRSSTI